MARKPVLSMALIVLVVLFLFTTRKYTQHSDALSRYTNANPAEDVTSTDPNSQGMHGNRHEAHMHDSKDKSMGQMHEEMSESSDESMEHMHEEMSESNDAKMDSEMEHMHEEMESADTERMEEQMEYENHDNHENHKDVEKAHMKESNDDKSVKNSQKVSDNIPDMEELAKGKPIMAKMPNQTTRAHVGNAGWKLLHTILAQYPEKPTEEDQQTLSTFIKFFSRVYPCRECAEHFQDLLANYPPQLSSRKTAAMWGCDAHNKVNKRLGKPIFDCAYIFDEYDCGCGEEAEGEEATDGKSEKTTNKPKPSQKSSESSKSNEIEEEKPAKQESTEEMMSTDK